MLHPNRIHRSSHQALCGLAQERDSFSPSRFLQFMFASALLTALKKQCFPCAFCSLTSKREPGGQPPLAVSRRSLHSGEGDNAEGREREGERRNKDSAFSLFYTTTLCSLLLDDGSVTRHRFTRYYSETLCHTDAS